MKNKHLLLVLMTVPILILLADPKNVLAQYPHSETVIHPGGNYRIELTVEEDGSGLAYHWELNARKDSNDLDVVLKDS